VVSGRKAHAEGSAPVSDNSPEFWRVLKLSALALAMAALVCGWHYVRVWEHFGRPLIGNWDTRAGFSWWQDDGYRTSAYYLRFGEVLIRPWYNSFTSFADGIYSTLWGDGLFSGQITNRLPWNYDLMS